MKKNHANKCKNEKIRFNHATMLEEGHIRYFKRFIELQWKAVGL